MVFVSRLEWCADKRELGGGEEEEVGGFRWGGERYRETTVVLPDPLSCFDWTMRFRSGVEADGPSDPEGDRYYGPEGWAQRGRRGSAALVRARGAGIGRARRGPERVRLWVARIRGEKWFSLTLCLSGTRERGGK